MGSTKIGASEAAWEGGLKDQLLAESLVVLIAAEHLGRSEAWTCYPSSIIVEDGSGFNKDWGVRNGPKDEITLTFSDLGPVGFINVGASS